MSTIQTLRGVPVFPLPDFYLFPGTVAPLHIFETRYRQMMQDLMDSSGRFVMAPCAADAPRGPTGPVLPDLGTLAEIVQTEELEDGRWLVLLLALSRVSMVEVPSDRLYRKVDARLVNDPEVEGEVAPRLREQLMEALQSRSNGNWDDMPGEAPVGQLADLLLHALRLDPALCGGCYVVRDPFTRAMMALALHSATADMIDGDDAIDDDDAPPAN
jgi:Lon protease-like protein